MQYVNCQWRSDARGVVSIKLVFQRIESLPKLAWCVRVERLQESATVVHGPWVECSDEFFCEGAWGGDFSKADFECTPFMGSGGKIVTNGLLIASPNHTLERIYLWKDEHMVLASNSLSFVLAQARDDIDPKYLLYGPRVASIIHGLDKYARTLPTAKGNRMQMHCHCNLLIQSDLRVMEEEKEQAPEFTDFAEYRSYLEEHVAAIAANANDERRRVQYRPIASISSGYDSPACAVFARQVGCTEALTFGRSRPGTRGEQEDSGHQIAAVLGMKVRTHNRLDYLTQTGYPEAECGTSEFICWADSLERRLLFTGFNGSIWERTDEAVSPRIVRRDTSGNNLAEFRLRVGFIHLPVAYLGCTSHPSIHRISNSEEMRPWSVGNSYDKPIPRRVVEEAGVERHLFATAKKAVAVVAAREGFAAVMTAESFEDFSRFCENNSNAVTRMKILCYRAAQYCHRLNLALNRRVSRVLRRYAGLSVRLPVLMPRDIQLIAGTHLDRDYTLFFHWRLNKLKPRYRT